MLTEVRKVEELEDKLKQLESSLPNNLTLNQHIYLHNLKSLIADHKKFYQQREELDRLESVNDSIGYDKLLRKYIPLRDYLLKNIETSPTMIHLFE
jgi:DNA repair exonuclease SbcCD ATPase subunit